ncbi:DUF1702 family protein [Longirhabdus pacifica]|uniref:DUF1702 family protein n=1 Tax=Longirhabdus pacifica TaxID=2305227 RepID=UPI00100896FB|nr:DUF1702 family protein [Longirhabdus pacifica]
MLWRWLHQKESKVKKKVTILKHSSDPIFVTRFETILQAFLYGYHSVLQPKLDMEQTKRKVNAQYDVFFRGFAYEGMGMGLGARTLYKRSEKKVFEHHIHALSPAYLYQYYVGLGWWLFVRYRFRTEGYRKWLLHLHPVYQSIVFDGVGFHTSLFQTPLQDIVKKYAAFGPDHERVCYQGLGRCLWFQHQFHIQRIIQALPMFHRRFHADIMSGVGLAAAYSCFDRLPWIFQTRASIPAHLLPAYSQGLAFGLQARKLQTPDFPSTISHLTDTTEKKIQQWLTIIDDVYDQLYHQSKQQLYLTWLDQVRARLSEAN